MMAKVLEEGDLAEMQYNLDVNVRSAEFRKPEDLPEGVGTERGLPNFNFMASLIEVKDNISK